MNLFIETQILFWAKEFAIEKVNVKLDDLIDALKLGVSFSQVKFDKLENMIASNFDVGKNAFDKHLQGFYQDLWPYVELLDLSGLFIVFVL